MVLRLVRAVVRGIGWLLTPAIVAATSAGALWLGARLGSGVASANLALATAVGAAIVTGTAVFAWWVLSLARARSHARSPSRPAARSTEPDRSSEVEDVSSITEAPVPASSSVGEAAD